MLINLKPLVRGVISYFIPDRWIPRKGTGGSNSAEYCYSVWLRHLVQLQRTELISSSADLKRIAELGPGDSLGIGISALFSGVKEYYALDVIEHSNIVVNKMMIDSIGKLFANKAGIPNGTGFVGVNPKLVDYNFPDSLIDEFDYSAGKEIELALTNKSQNFRIEYVVPWDSTVNIRNESLDLIFSQAVMEHVNEIDDAYAKMFQWLRPGGLISHQIDFKAHEISDYWSGHWYISKKMWKVLMHGRKYIINRSMLSDHLHAIAKAGFVVKNIVPVRNVNPLENGNYKLNRTLNSPDDLNISSCLIQAIKL